MARLTRTHGACPACGTTVERTVNLHHGIVSEAYHCPEHGRMTAAPHGATVSEWAMPSMASLAEILGVPPARSAWA